MGNTPFPHTVNTLPRRRQRILSATAVSALFLAFLIVGSAAAQVTNSQPAFPSSEDGARSVAENTAAGANIGAPVGATDADTDALYVSTSEGNGADKILRVTPQVAPRFPANTDTTWDTPENADITTIVATVAAEEPNGEAITYSLGGTDAASFNINDTTVGELRANAPLDYETKSSYQVDVIATDPNNLSSKVTLTITVTNEDEAGAITLSSQAPVVGIDLTASITDLDGGVSIIGWTWSKSSDQTTWTAIAGATSSTYRPVAADVGSYLRATAAYTDSQGSGKNAQQKTDAPVVAAPSGVAVTVSDDETAGVTVSETTLTLDEGGSATYTVVLNRQPTSDVVIGVTRSGSPDVTVSPATLTFTPANWSTAQTVTVRGAQDADAVNDTAAIAHAVDASQSADEYDTAAIAGVSVTVTDDDTAGVTVSETALTLDEGASATYTVVLNAQPASNVLIRIDNNNLDVGVDADAGRARAQAFLLFTPGNWSTPQTVKVSAAQDADAADDQAQLDHAVSYTFDRSGPYNSVLAAGVAVTVTDDETAGVTVSETTLTLDEGASATYTVVLNAQPAADVLIRIDNNNQDVKVDADAIFPGLQAFMLFTPGNWNTPQTVKVSAAQDADAADDQAQLDHAVSYTADRSGPYNSVLAAGVAVTVIDDETVGVTVSETTLTVVEGASNTYTVKLDPQPSSDVVITVTSSNSAVTPAPARLTFTSSNWSTAQTVTVRAAHDADAVNDSAAIAHAVVPAESADEYDTATIAGVAVTVADDDAGVTNSESTLAVAEGGSATYTVVLNTQPSADVAIIIADDNPDVTLDTDATQPGIQNRLTFTPSNWNTPQTVTVAAAHDADAVNDKAQLRYTVSSDNVSGPYSGLAAAGVAVTVTDDDTVGVTVSETTLTVAEGGDNTYTVVLDAQPTSDVVINVTKSGSTDVTVSPATLTFTGDNWDTAQTVTVAAAQDADAADDSAAIAHAVAPAESADEYDTATIAGVAVTVDDDETAGVTVSRPRMRMDEGGSNTYTVALNAQPTSDVVIAVTSNNSDVTVDTDAATSGSQNTLTFTPNNWSTAQTVRVAADQDADAANDKAAITHAVVAAQSADEYDNVTIARVRVTVIDDETPTAGVTSSVSRLTVAEGGSATYTVVLNTSPPGAFGVTVFVLLVSDGNVTRAPASLFFTSSNWDTAQTVTMSASQDIEASDRAQVSYVVRCTCSQYNGLRYDNVVEVIVVDDDAVGVTVSETAVSVIEGGNSNYTVVLNKQPSSDVVIDVTASGNTDVTVSPATLTFTSSNWGTAQTVTARAAQDADAANDTAAITHAVVAAESADEYDNVSIAGVTVTVTDDETAGVTVSETALEVAEGGNNTYTVVLGAQPTSGVVINVTASGSPDVTVSPATLTFTPANWSTAQTVTVAAAQDADAVDAAASISHAVDASRSADEYDAVTIAGVAVTVTDDETAGVTVSRPRLRVNEGGSKTYTVKLGVQPTSDVVINVTKSGSADVTVSPATLTFTSSNWDTAQTVTVAAAEDADAVNDAAAIAHAVDAARSADEYDNVTIAGVAVTVTDDETAGATVSETTLTVAEGGSATYTVVLDVQPASNVVISVTASGSSDVTVSPATLTFTTANWDTAQTVTVAAAQDADAVDDAASIAHAVDAARSADEYDNVTIAGVAVTVTDDDTAGATVSETALEVAEGGSATYTVVLNLQPTSDVVISVTASGNTDVTVSPATLTFTTANWDTAQTVTVAAAQDADAVDDAASIAHAVDAARSADEYDNVTIAGVAVTVTDDETAGVTVSVISVKAPEGGSATYTVVLDVQPTSDVVINVTKSGSSDVTVSPATLTFTTANWDTAQTVTVSAAQDADAVDDAAAISHAVVDASSDDLYDGLQIARVSVTVTEDDPGMRVSQTDGIVMTEGIPFSYTVALTTKPTSNVALIIGVLGSRGITVDGSPITFDLPGLGTLAAVELLFTPANWNTPQTVTVRAPDDDDSADDSATIYHGIIPGSSAEEYRSVPLIALEVFVNDDDPGVTVSPKARSLAEGGSATYTVLLDTEAASDVVISVSSDNTDVTVSPATLTFTTANWGTAQTVTVRAAHDADAVNDAASITHAVVDADSDDLYDGLRIARVSVTVTDDDAGVSVSETALTVAEGGSATYTVKLDAQPASDVVITVSSDNSDVTADTDAATSGNQTTLTFTPANWSTAQTVTVRAAQDADAANDAASITHAVDASRSANEFDNVSSAGVAVTVTDDETAGATVSATTLTVTEGGNNTYTVVLDVQPTSDVVITVSSDNSDVTATPAKLTFTPSNWSTAQTVTVAAAQDADAVNDAAAIAHAVDAARSANEFDAVTIAGVAVTVTDDDAGATVSETTLTVAEGGNATYTVKLDAQPAADVVITVSSDNSDVTADTDGATSGNQTTLTFSPSNWDTAQTVTVSAAEDADAVNDAASITHAVVAASSADEFDAVSIAELAVTVTDDDAGVTVSETTVTVAEGTSTTYTVKLDAQPASNVVISVTRSGSPDVTVSPATLTFTRANWSTAQTVTVRAAQDADAVNDAASITHAVVAASSADEFDAVTIAGVTVTVADDDAGVTVSPATLRIPEGNSSTYTVVLDAQPASDVVITVSSGNTDVTVSSARLTFTTANWDTAKTVTVSAAEDADAVNDTASITHAVVAASSADEYDAVTIAGVAVTVTDDDAGVSVSETTLTVTEGGSATYTVKLAAQPASDVVITVSSGNTDVTVSPATLTFTPSNWSTAQTVTVAAAQDADAVNDAAAIAHAVDAARSADEFDAVTIAGVAVTVTDDDARLVLDVEKLKMDEGSSSTAYDVKLGGQPTGNVVVRVTVSGSSDVAVDTDGSTDGDQDTLTFTNGNWDKGQLVRVRAAQDADAVDDAASITHSVVDADSADEFDAAPDTVRHVTVDDNDAGVTVSASKLTVDEGTSATYTVVLDALPAADVVITVSSDNSDVTVSPATLTFTPANWSTAKTVTVSAAQDADAVNDAASIAHAVTAASSAKEYDAVTIAGVTVTVADDDAGVTVSETALTVAEGGSATYTVVLDALPDSDVVITVTRSGDVTATPAKLTFTTANWSTAQTVTVRGAQDADAVNDAASITHAVNAASSAKEYDAVTIAGVAVTVTDDDDATLVVPGDAIMISEGIRSGGYTVRLSAQPTSNVVVRVTVSGSSDVAVDTDGSTDGDQDTLTFTNGNWDTGQLVRVRAAEDADAVDDEASITHSVVDAESADEFDAAPDAVRRVTVDDDDTAGATVSETTLTVAEGGSATYTVVLDVQPTSNVVIGVTKTGSSDVTVSPATLTFSSSNWDTAKTVTVSAAQDADAVNDAASITHAVNAAGSANEFDAATIAGVAVTVTDDETAGATVSETTLEVDEGGSATYTVKLDAQPASDVVISVTKSGSPDVTVSPATLTFSTSNWSTAQTVTVAAAQDPDAVNDAASITHAVDAARSADEYDAVAVAAVAVTVSDDDAGVTVSETTLEVAEGGSGAYTVKLNAQPAADVVISVSRSGSADVTASPATLTFTPSNWSTAQTVTVRAAQDADAVNDTASIAHAVVAARSADEYDAVAVAAVAVTVSDDDAGVTVSETTLTVAEGGNATYTVKLNAQPAADVVISVSRSGSADVTASPATLTFTPSNWSTAQTVTVRAAQDADAVNDTGSIAHAVVAARSANEYDAVAVAAVAVTVSDDDDAGVTVSETTLTVAEGGNGAYTVKLNAQPAADVVISVSRSGSADVTASPATLTFTPSNWSTAQTVTVRAAQDADAVNDTGSIAHAVVAARSANEYDAVAVAAVAVTVSDDDDAGVTVSETTLTVAEGGNGAYTVKLNAQPAADVVISVSRSGSADVTASPATLTFTPSNWSTAQTVTVRAAQDADAANDTASIAHAVVAARSANEYDAVAVAAVAVTVSDDDDAGVTVSETALTVAEGGSATYTVKLDAQPASDVVISVSRSGSADVTASPATLTFTPSNWSTAQTVTVRAAQDADAVNDTASIAHAVVAARSANEYDAVAVAAVAVTVSDDDDAGVTVSETTLEVAEGGSGAYTVKLNAQPASDVVISVSRSGSADVTASPATLTFTPSNWSTAQTVTVRAAQDADAVNDTGSIAHAVVAARSANEYDAVAVAAVAVTVSDDDDAGVTVSETTLTVAEGGNGAYTVKLNAQPAADVVISVSRSGSADVTASPATLTFTPSNWSTAQTVTVRAAQDADAANDAASIAHAVVAARSANEYDAVAVAAVAVTVSDDDAGVTVSETTLTVAEGGSATYTVKLDAQPASDVVISVSRSGSADVTASPATLTFTPSNWSTAQTVTVRAAQDADAVNDTGSIAHAVVAARSANEYDAVAVAAVAVTVSDDDDAGVTVSETTLTVAEGGNGAYTVKLNAQPAADVVISVSRSGSADVTASPATLTFTPSNWSTAQTVTVRAAQDADAANDAASIAHAVVAARSANEYDAVAVAAVAVTVSDDDAGVTVSETTLTVAEGGSATYTVKLDAQPASDVVISVSRSGSADVTASPATLTFTPSNWSTAQTVTVRAAQDADAVNDTASIAHAVVAARSANEYDAVAVAAVAVTVSDDDDAGVTVSETTLEVAEGGSGAYTVKLNAQPASDVVISVSRSGSADVTASPATLTFTPSNWSTAQTVTVRAAQDADAVNDTGSIAHAVVAARSANEYDAVAVAAVAVTVSDDDAGVTVSETTLTVAEGGNATYTVVLDAQPAADVVISVSRSGSADVTASPATLTFTPSNWSTAQTVTVRAAQDADAVNDTGSIAHAVVAARSANEYDAVAVAAVAVTVSDDDDAGVTVSASTLTVAEGGNGAYTVKLNAQPASDVVISVSRSGSADVTASPATLTFTPSNWSTAQTVTVRAAQDADAANDTGSIAHAVVAARSANEYDAVAVAAVAVTVSDDDDAGVTVSETALTVAEGGNGAYTVKLNAQPAADVVISVSRSGSADVTASPATLTFTPSNWSTAQTVTVRAAQDADAANDAASIAHAVVAARSANEYDAVAVAAVAVTVSDDDAGVTVSETTLTVAEGGSGAYTVKLNAQPAADVVISVTRSGSADVTASPATLTFTRANWSTAQTVTVRAAQDADAANDAASIAHAVVAARSANEYDAVAVAAVAVTVSDDDAGVTVSETTLTVAEGGSGAYTVKLNAQPAADVVISVTRSGSADVTASPATLTFTRANWSTAQTVTVRAAQDADAANDAASIAHAVVAARSANEYDAVAVAAVAVTVTDDDDAGVTVSASTLTVAEGGNGAYTVKLNAQPASDVVISVSRSGSADVTASPATLTFTPSNWSTAQTVTVRAAQDADAANDAASIAHAVVAARSANEYDAVAVAAVAVTVSDDDAGVTVSETALTVAEGGNATYTVVLDAQPAADVVISVSRSGSADVTASPATLTFTRANWSTAQTVTVAGAEDADAVNDAASIAHAVVAARSADEYDGATIAAVAVTVSDDDAGVTVSETALEVAEGGSGAYTVKLDAQPASDVVISVPRSGSADVTVSPATLTFTRANWSTAQTVTVRAAEDADAANDAASIAHAVVAARSADEYDAVAVAAVAVTVSDDDAGVTVSETTLTVAEGGSGAYTVVLDAQPAADVVISVTRSGSADVTASPATLTFTRANWSTAQTVTVRAAEDADAANDAASIAHAVVAARSADEYDAVAVAAVAVTVSDETAGVTVSETTLTVAEGGSGAYTVVLDAQPAADVVISVTRSGSADVTASPATLTFTRANWSTAQTVTVRAAEDADAVNDAASITHAVDAASSANEFDAVAVAAVAVTVSDDETAGVTVSETTLTVAEGGSGAYTVVLDAQPAADVVISVTRSGSADVTASPATLTFTRANWSTAQTVTVRAAEDADAANDAASIAHAVVAARSADEYDAVAVAAVAVTVSDDDAGVTVSETTLEVAEGGSGAYTVVLDAQPASDVVISVPRSGSADVTASPATLTFTRANWSTAQTVTVRAAEDADAVNDAASIAHAVVAARSADEYDGATIAAVAVTVSDDEAAGVAVTVTDADDPVGIPPERTSTEAVERDGYGWTGIWSDGDILWQAVNVRGADDAIHAYDLASGKRIQEREFELDETNRAPRGLWSDGVTIWVSDSGQDRLFAYKLESGERLQDRELALVGQNGAARGIWSDGKLMWVLDANQDALFAYIRSSGELIAKYSLHRANGDPRGLWSDGITIWVSDHRLFAYALPVPRQLELLTFTASGGSAQTVEVSTIEDGAAERGETFTLELRDASGGGGEPLTVSGSPLTTTINDDDAPRSGIALSVSERSIAEGSAATTLTVTATMHGGATLPTDTTLRLSLGGSASSGADYTATPLGAITVAAGRPSATTSFLLTPSDDSVVEGDETILVQGVHSGRLTVTEATITLEDDDRATLAISAPAGDLEEGSDVTFTVTLSAEVAAAVSVAWSVSGDAVAGRDYWPTSGSFMLSADSVVNTMPVTFAVGSVAGATRTITLALADDNLSELAESLTVSLGPAGGNLPTGVTVDEHNGEASATIAPSDPITVVLEGDASVDEGATATYPVSLSPTGVIPSADLTVGYTTANGSARAGTDYRPASGSLTFTASGGSAQTVQVSTIEDGAAERGETFTLELRDASGGGGEPLTVSGSPLTTTINDDDAPRSGIALSVSERSIAEGSAATTLTVTATMHGGATLPTDTTLRLSLGGSASSGADYTATPLGAITIAAGRPSATTSFLLTPSDDSVVEGDETILVQGVHSGRLTVTEATITLEDDDRATLAISAPAGDLEEGSDVTFTVTLSAEVAAAVSVAWSVSGDAVAGRDYWPTSGSFMLSADSVVNTMPVTFAVGSVAGATRTITLALADDNLSELAESLTVSLGPAGGNLPTGVTVDEHNGEASATIAPSDPITVVLEGDASVDEGATATYPVSLSPTGVIPSADLTVGYTTANGSARAGTDYRPASGSLTFPQGSPAASALVRVRDRDFAQLRGAGNSDPRGIWSDCGVMYVADAQDERHYRYDMPKSIDTCLASLSLSGMSIDAFFRGTTDYWGLITPGLTVTTVEAEARRQDATVVIEPADRDADPANGHQVAVEPEGEITVTVISADGSRRTVYRVRPVCLSGELAVGFSFVLYAGGSVEELEACALSRGVVALYALADGAYVPYILGAPRFVNQPFRELFAEALAPLTPLVAVSNESQEGRLVPGEIHSPTGSEPETWPGCLHGAMVEGFNLVVYEGGSVGELAACMQSQHVSALYTLHDSEFTPYILGAPPFVNAPFRELFTDGVRPLTPLIAKHEPPLGERAGEGTPGSSGEGQ